MALLVITSLAAGAAVIGAATDASAQQSDPGDGPAAATPVSLSGVTAADAAASCWEIKQVHPDSADGVYWLRNEHLVRPAQFYCDMTTDGGGWVMIGRGRDGWTFRDYGQSTPQQLLGAVTGPQAFSPAALSSETIDALLGGRSVSELADGLRIRRAKNIGGTDWQELRWQFLDLGAWSWALGGGHRLASFSIDGTTGSGSNTKDSNIRMPGEVGAGNRGATNHDGWFTFPWSGHGRQAGFSYRGSISGQRNNTSYLWEFNTERSALPFTQLFLRPTLTSATPVAIADEGLPAEVLAPMLDDRPAEIAGGVLGLNSLGDSEPNLRVPVADITSLGDRVYVGGKFSQVRDASTGQLVGHSYLAAFDRETGAWISSFRPQLDGTVWAVEIVDGRLIVAGQFTNVDGVAGTQGLAALDPITGAVDPTWRASLTLNSTSMRAVAYTLDREGDWLYVGGNFTRVDGPTRSLGMGRLAKVSVANGDPNQAFRPNVGGVPFDVDAAGSTVQVVGRFTGINGDTRRSIGTLDADTGQVVTGLETPVWTVANNSRRYQFAVLDLGDEVWNGGSEHDTQVYRKSDYQYLRGFVTADQGGDTQVLELSGDKVMQGSHGNAWIYHDATAWPGLDNYSRADLYNWIGMFDAATRTYERDWVPGLGSAYSSGAWALHTDADGCLWFGGDMLGGPFVNGQRQYLESFSKFCPRDTTAPTTPGNAAAQTLAEGGVRVAWTPSTDDRTGFLGYEVLRNDRVITPLLYASSFVDPTGTPADRYFVRAVDPAGNRSATSTVLIPGDTQRPTAPRDLAVTVLADGTVDVSWTASTDNVGVTSYSVLRNNVEVVSVPGSQTSVNVALGFGTHYIAVQALDAAGNASWKTPSLAAVVVPPPSLDTQRPTAPRDLAVTVLADGTVDVSWTASTDNVGVTSYSVLRNNVEVVSVPGSQTSVNVALGFGTHYIAVQALDAAGNASWKTPSLAAVVVPPPSLDTQRPTAPRDLAVTVLADGTVDVSWTASTDNVGVTSYSVLRNNVEVVSVPGSQTSVNVALGFGTHYIAVQALDAAGNASWKTPSLAAVVVPPPSLDTQRPTAPRDLAVTVLADGTVDVSWTASTDNVGVTSYSVLRNNVEVVSVPGSQTSVNVALGFGTHYIAVQALDAAGNASWKTPSLSAVVQ
jgi:trimeric autotransporter adhesin